MFCHLEEIQTGYTRGALESPFASLFSMSKYLQKNDLSSRGFVFSNPEIVAPGTPVPMFAKRTIAAEPHSLNGGFRSQKQ